MRPPRLRTAAGAEMKRRAVRGYSARARTPSRNDAKPDKTATDEQEGGRLRHLRGRDRRPGGRERFDGRRTAVDEVQAAPILLRGIRFDYQPLRRRPRGERIEAKVES